MLYLLTCELDNGETSVEELTCSISPTDLSSLLKGKQLDACNGIPNRTVQFVTHVENT